MIILATILSSLSLLLSVLFLIQLKLPLGWILLFPRLAAGAFSPYWATMGIVGAIIGWAYGALWAIPLGIVGAGTMIWYVWRCTRDHNGFEDAFGSGWEDHIPPQQTKHMVKTRWSPYLKMEGFPKQVWERDIPFWRVPDTDQELLCDIWRPADDDVSGLAFVYIHGGAWFMWDKDTHTRPFFRHLVAQGHTVMDVSYRLCPEVDIYGMIGDVKHAVAWMKANASRYGVDPEKIILGGASAGGHLAQLAGYAPQHPELTPEDLKSADLSVCGIISYYGFTDLLILYQQQNLQQLEGQPPVPVGTVLDATKRSRLTGRLDILLGGWPQDAPDMYQLASPITHVHPDCPPTLLIQGEQDIFCPVGAIRAHFTKLIEAGVPAINIVYPWTDHGFDLLVPPQTNPAAQSALYDVDRFLALLLNKNQKE